VGPRASGGRRGDALTLVACCLDNHVRVIAWIVGPSGIGKSTLSAAAGDALGVHVVELDDVTRSHEFEWTAIKPQLDAISASRVRTIVVIGAGGQCVKEMLRFVSDHAADAVSVWAQSQVAWARIHQARNDTRSLEQYREIEYNEHRVAIYDAPHNRLDTSTVPLLDCIRAFCDMVKTVIEAP